MKKNSNLRLAILGTRGVPARYGGFETFAEQLAIRLVRRGIDVTVFCEDQGEANPPDSYQGVRLLHVRAPAIGPLSTIIFDIRCLWIARKNYDVAYMLGYGVGLFCFIPRLWGREVWVNMDGIEWSRSKWNWLAKAWLRFMERAATWTSDRLIADSHGIREHLEAHYGSLPEVSVIPYGADVVEEPPARDILDELRLEPQCYYLIVCRLEPENHVLEMLRAYIDSYASEPFVVVGNVRTETPYVRELRKLTDNRVRFVGTIYNQDKLQSLRWYCKGYFHGHSVGGTNPSLLEALGCGNTIVAHDNVFNREVAGDCAYYFSSAADIRGIVDQIGEKPLTETRRLKSLERVAAKYDWEDIADAYEALLKRK